MFLEKARQVIAADFLLALDEKDKIRGQRAACCKEFAHAKDMSQNLPLVVRGTAGINPPVANRGLERRRLPFSQGLGRLYVVVAVDKNRWPRRIVWRPGNYRRMTAGLADIRLKPETEKFVFQPFRARNHVHNMFGLGRYAGKPEELKKIAYAGIVHGNSIG